MNENKIFVEKDGRKLIVMFNDDGSVQNIIGRGFKAKDFQTEKPLSIVREILLNAISWKELCQHNLGIDYLV